MDVHVDEAVSRRVEAMIDAEKRARELRAAGEDIKCHRGTLDCADPQNNGADDPTILGVGWPHIFAKLSEWRRRD